MLPGADARLEKEMAKALHVAPKRILSVEVTRRSVDARKKQNVHFVISAHVEVDSLSSVGELHPIRGVQVSLPKEPKPLSTPDLSNLANVPGSTRPVVVGAGPAGLFCALRLARAGLRPLLIERGKPAHERARDVDAFANGGPLNTQSNIQFGEGGAGTFSDGKLTTGTKGAYNRAILEEFVACGAPDDILIDAKPHIGTDYLPSVVENIRQCIIQAGGEVRFSTQLIGISRKEPNEPNGDGAIGLTIRNLLTGQEEQLTTDALVLALGHSARDTFQMLEDAGVAMERKPFAMGVRIEHLQEDVDRAQYGQAAGHPALPPAEYKLSAKTRHGRGVYTFCMCPGGEVVAAASEEGAVCVNGMSTHARNGRNANSALLVEVHPDDLPGKDVLEGMRLQRELEQAAFRAGGGDYKAPAQTVGSFLGGEGDKAAGSVSPAPTYPRGTQQADLHEVLPPFMTDAMHEALPALGRKLAGFDSSDAVMTAVEARSSSPVRIIRDPQTLESANVPGLYPAGEGAGYAGGIMSAANDGMRVADAVVESAQVKAAARVLREGCPVAFPTDTVFGVGVSTKAQPDATALAHIKGRDEGKPVAWLVASPDALDVYGKDVPEYARKLAEDRWPGALTLVVRASDAVPEGFQSSAGTIGLRMPASAFARRLICEVGAPLAVTSANMAGDAAPSSAEELSPAFRERAAEAGALIVQSAQRGFGTASEVIDCTGATPKVLRPV